MAHTILLVQAGRRMETRTYSDFDSIKKCMDGVCQIYEKHFKSENPDVKSFTYNVAELLKFIDDLYDFGCLVYQQPTNTYAPFNKEWIKEKLYTHLQQDART